MKLYFAALGLLKMFFATAYFNLLLILAAPLLLSLLAFVPGNWFVFYFALPSNCCWCYIVGVYLILLNAF